MFDMFNRSIYLVFEYHRREVWNFTRKAVFGQTLGETATALRHDRWHNDLTGAVRWWFCWKGNGSLIRPSWPIWIVKVDNWWKNQTRDEDSMSTLSHLQRYIWCRETSTNKVSCNLLWGESSKIEIQSMIQSLWSDNLPSPHLNHLSGVHYRAPLSIGKVKKWSDATGASQMERPWISWIPRVFLQNQMIYSQRLEVQDHKNIRTNKRTANQKLSIQARIRYMSVQKFSTKKRKKWNLAYTKRSLVCSTLPLTIQLLLWTSSLKFDLTWVLHLPMRLCRTGHRSDVSVTRNDFKQGLKHDNLTVIIGTRPLTLQMTTVVFGMKKLVESHGKPSAACKIDACDLPTVERPCALVKPSFLEWGTWPCLLRVIMLG